MMKKIALAGAVLAMAMSAETAVAGPTQDNMGINVDFANTTTPMGTPSNFLVKGKYFISNNMAVEAGAGMRMVDTGAATNATHTDIGLLGGFRKYLGTDDLAPFFGGRLQYLSVRSGASDLKDLSVLAEAGAEYYFNKRFSLEGSVAAGYETVDASPVGGGTTVTATNFGTASLNMSANFYF
jgi:hypothetical protein